MEGIKVLLVDDEQEFIETLAKRLNTRGFQAATALSGDAAIALLRERDFDVVILDVVMPGKDGIETLQEIKSLKPLTSSANHNSATAPALASFSMKTGQSK